MVVHVLPELVQLKQCRSVFFSHNNLHSFAQLERLAKALPPQITEVRIEHNPVSRLSLTRRFIVHRMPHLSRVDGAPVSAEDREAGEALLKQSDRLKAKRPKLYSNLASLKRGGSMHSKLGLTSAMQAAAAAQANGDGGGNGREGGAGRSRDRGGSRDGPTDGEGRSLPSGSGDRDARRRGDGSGGDSPAVGSDAGGGFGFLQSPRTPATPATPAGNGGGDDGSSLR